ncbi:MAG: hypothetical protein ABSD58_11305 [Verrucomicrobiia bacterium]|jgi:hypothetical protein
MQHNRKPGRPKAEHQKRLLPAKIALAYCDTESLEKTAALCGVAPNTVRRILEDHPDDFAAARKLSMSKMMVVADAAVDIAAQRIGECSAPQAAVVAGIFTQRSGELSDKLPPADTPDVEQALEESAKLQAKLDQEIALLEQLRDKLTSTPQPAAAHANAE